MSIRSRQGGMTMISWVALIGLIGFVGIFGFKLLPIFMEYHTIDSAMQTVSKNMEAGESPAQIRTSISGLFDVNSVERLKPADVDIKIDPDTKATVLGINYDARTNFIGNVDLIVHFEKTYPAGGH